MHLAWSLPVPLLSLVLLLLTAGAGAAHAVDLPPEGRCPPYAEAGSDGPQTPEDVIPSLLRPGQRVPMDDLGRIAAFLPPEVWARRDSFFFEGMQLVIGPCHRRYRAPTFFEEATRRDAGRARIDEDGNLLDYPGRGLPFPIETIADDDAQAGLKWAWNSRYRYLGTGLRGDFRILLVARRGLTIERYTGDFYLLSMGRLADSEEGEARFWAGGRFTSPSVARGVAWRQLRPAEADRKPTRSDEVWVYVPEERKTRRAPPTSIDGVYTPSFTRGQSPGRGRLYLPDGTQTPDPSIAVTEHTRRGFTGLLTRPNMYEFRLERVQDVIAPINTVEPGYPTVDDRSYGPRGLSLASDRWDLRRAIVIRGERKRRIGRVHEVEFYVDAQTQQPLYMISRRGNGHLVEVGILAGRFSAEDPAHPDWEGSTSEQGAILPVASSFVVSGDGGWLRESFELRSDPPDETQRREYTTTIPLRRGR